MAELDKYEKDLEDSIVRGEWKTVKNFEKKKQEYVEIAKTHLKKEKKN